MSRDTTSAKVVLHYGDQWSVFSGGDYYCERRLYWSHDRDRAAKFARAHTAWVRKGYPIDQRPLGLNDDGSVYRQHHFDARRAA